MTPKRALALVAAVLAGGVAGYAVRGGEDASDPRQLARSETTRAEHFSMRACPASTWARGGGYDYAVAGISCREANSFILHGRRYQPGAQEGLALRFGEWICFQRAVRDGARRRATLNICANGESRLRFLMG